MARPFKRRDHRLVRNLDIFWSVHRDSLTQDEVAAKYGISQQRVSVIVRSMAVFVALAPSEEYDHIPQKGQLQYGYRIWQARMEARRAKLVKAFDKSMEGVTSFEEFSEDRQEAGADKPSHVHRKQSSIKSQHGDWRIDRQIEQIDKAMLETRIGCYGRDWLGWEQLEKSGMARKRKAEGGKRGKGMGSSEFGMRNDGGGSAAVVVSASEGVESVVAVATAVVEEPVPSTEYSVLGTLAETPAVAEQAPVVAPVANVEPAPTCRDSAFPIPNSAFAPPASQSAIRNPQSAIPPKRRSPPISKLTGKPVPTPVLQTPEFLRMHGLDPADYGGGCEVDTTPLWITGAQPREVLSRDVCAMNREEYREYLRDLLSLEAQGFINEDSLVPRHPKHDEWRASEGLWDDAPPSRFVRRPRVR